MPSKDLRPLSIVDNGRIKERETRLELATSSLGSNESTVVSDNPQGLTTTHPDACTSACTSDAENANNSYEDAKPDKVAEGDASAQPDPLAAIATALGVLSPDDRARLAKMLLGE